MRLRSTLRAIATTVAGLAVVATALPHPQAQETITAESSTVQTPTVSSTRPLVWVHVNTSRGRYSVNTYATTITPTPTSDANGAPTTLSAPPEHLTATSVYTSLEGGTKPIAYTGITPVAYTGINPTPTGRSEDGDFLACDISTREFSDDPDGPFCTPRRGTVLRPGKGYYSEQIPIKITLFHSHVANHFYLPL